MMSMEVKITSQKKRRMPAEIHMAVRAELRAVRNSASVAGGW